MTEESPNYPGPLEPQHEPSPSSPVGPSSSGGSSLPYFLALAVLFVIGYGAFKWWQVHQFDLRRGEAIPMATVGPPLTEFELTERSGEPFRSADMKGKVWVVTYFFTTCPGSCVRLNQNIKFMNDLPDIQDVVWVSITCDPANDTIESLAAYAERLNADPERWLFCRADLEYTQRVALGMNLALYRQGHQDYAIVIDKSGKVRGMFNAASKSDCERMHTLLVQCLEEPYPQEMAAAESESGSG